MKILTIGLAVMLLSLTGSAQTLAQKFLHYCYGAEGIDISAICHPTDDLWMLRGAKQDEAIKAVNETDLKLGNSGVFSGPIGRDFCVVQMRDGKVDPSYNLEHTYSAHRQLVLQFVFACLTQDKQDLAKLITNPTNVSFGKTKPAAGGDLDVYGSVISLIPVVRSSKPASDKTTKSISYRLPIGRQEIILKLIKRGSTWLVDGSSPINMPMEFFYEEGPNRKVLNP